MNVRKQAVLAAFYVLMLVALVKAQNSQLCNQSCNIWKLPETFSPGSYSGIQMLDTFSNHIIINSTTPLNISLENILTKDTIPMNYSGTHIDFYFNESEGCNVYFIVFQAANPKVSYIVNPDVTATYDPTPYLTGWCLTSETYALNQTQKVASYAAIAKSNPLVQQGVIGNNYTTQAQFAQLGWMLTQYNQSDYYG